MRALALTPQGDQLISASTDGTLRIWDTATGAQLHAVDPHQDWVNRVVVTSDGRYVLSTSDSVEARLMLTRIATGSPVAVWNGHRNWVLGLAVTPDSRYALSASGDGSLRLWDLAVLCAGKTDGMRSICVFSADDALSTCAVWPDSRTIVVGDHSGRIHRLRLREPPTRRESGPSG